MSSAIIPVTEANFDQEVLGADRLVLIVFKANWAEPSKALMQTMEKFAEENAGRVKTVCVDVEDEANLTTAFNIRSVPTLVTVQGNQAVFGLVGNQPRRILDQLVAESLQSTPPMPSATPDSPLPVTGKPVTVMRPLQFRPRR